MLEFKSHRPLSFAALMAVASLLGPLRSDDASARGGTHGLSVSTWDASSSTVVVAFQNGFLTPDGGHLRDASYTANFSSTSGRLSSQFGLRYLNYAESDAVSSSHGIGGTALANIAVPVMRRYDNGLPTVSFNVFFGASPSALFSGQRNYITIPILLGFGLPWSPIKYLSIVPWVELAPSVNVDTYVKTLEQMYNELDIDPTDPTQIPLTEEQIQKILDESVTIDVGFAFKMRGGLSLVAHLGNRVDLQLNGYVTRIGPSDDNKTAVFIGGGLAIAWDDPVPAVLPPDKRLENERCDAIETRFKQCPAYRDLVDAAQTPAPDASAAPPNEPSPPKAEAPAPSEAPAPAPAAEPSPSQAPGETPLVSSDSEFSQTPSP